MAVPGGTVQTYGAIGIREDLTDMIWDISPTDTPFTSGIGRGTASNTLHEWQTDELDPANKDNAAVEGDDAAAPTHIPTVRLKNYTQIFTKTVIVSRTQRSVTTAGRADELAYQMTKKSREIRRDIEAACTQNNGAAAGDASTARTLGGYEAWIETNETRGATGSSGGASGTGLPTPPTDGTPAAYTEPDLKEVLRKCWEQGGNPTVCMVGPFNKQTVSGFDANATRFVPMQREEMWAAFDVYHSDFGPINIVPNRFSREQSALIIDMEFWVTSFLDGIQQMPLAKTGDADRRFLVGELTLESRNEKASGINADLTTS